MKFKTQTTDLVQALSIASVVRPKPIDSQGSAGYLFVVKGERCFVYSEDDHQKSRVDFPIFDVEGEGSFVYPTRCTAEIQFLEGWIELEPLEEGDSFLVKYTSEGGASAKKLTFAAGALHSLDRDLESANDGPAFPSVLLKEAVNLGKGYLADVNGSRSKEHFKCFQLFDDSKDSWRAGNGHLFAADGYRAFYFYSPEFEGKGLNIHTLRTSLLTSFLSKAKGDIQIRRSERSSYLVDKNNQVVGWSDPVFEHESFNYYPHAKDSHVLRVSQAIILKVLHHVRAALDAKRDKIRVQYNAERGILQFLVSDNGDETSSTPVPVEPLSPENGTDENPIRGGDKSKTGDFAFNVNINHFIDLFASAKGNAVELRVGTAKGNNFLIRTIDSFYMDPDGKIIVPAEGEQTYSCRVTRFMSNKK